MVTAATDAGIMCSNLSPRLAPTPMFIELPWSGASSTSHIVHCA